MNHKFSENLAKPCQTASRPEQVSPSDEAARTRPVARVPRPAASPVAATVVRVGTAAHPQTAKQSHSRPSLWNQSLAVKMGRPACVSHHLTVEARDKAAITSLCSPAVLPVPSSTPQSDKDRGAKLRTPRTDGLLTHFASPRGEKCRLGDAYDRASQHPASLIHAFSPPVYAPVPGRAAERGRKLLKRKGK